MTKSSLLITTLSLVAVVAAACTASQPAADAPTDTPAPTAAPEPTNAPVPAPTTSAGALDSAAAVAVADQLVDLLVAGDYAAAVSRFDAAMKTALPEAKMQAAWESLDLQFGAFKAKTDVRSTGRKDQYEVVLATLEFARGSLGLNISVDTGTGEIGGLFFVPVEQAPAAAYEPPAYVDTTKFDERDVTIGAGEWALPGTLTMPKGDGPFPAVVLVHGSGPNDRDETVGPNKPFKDLAWGLASRGIAVLRYDKRTKVHGEKIALLKTFTVQEETVEDAALAVELLKQTPGIDPQRVYVLGHSLGGFLIPRIAQARSDMAGLIVLAGLTRPLEDTMLEQVGYIFSLSDKPADDQLAELEKQVQAVKALTPADAEAGVMVLNAPASYWLDLKDYRPADMARTQTVPMLILQGERDYQVTMVDFENWQTALSARGDVQFKSYPDLNHLFIVGEGKSRPEEYQQAGHVAQIVIDDIAAWVK